MSYGQPVATVYDADIHCLSCTIKRFSNEEYNLLMNGHEDMRGCPTDSEGNPVHVLLDGQNDEDLANQFCAECGKPLCPLFPDCRDEHPECRRAYVRMVRQMSAAQATKKRRGETDAL